MMSESTFILGLGSAIWFGILTSISPCPLATNIAAVSFISKQVDTPRNVLMSGFLYTAGRIFSYCVLGILIIKGILAVFDMSMFMQTHMNQFLGVVLLLSGLILLKIIRLPVLSSGFISDMGDKLSHSGMAGSFFLGVLFALSFCPVSAALFFGSLIPIALKFNSTLLVPSGYAVGTALPVLFFAVSLGLGGNVIARAFDGITVFETWMRWITGLIFSGVGGYYIVRYLILPSFQ